MRRFICLAAFFLVLAWGPAHAQSADNAQVPDSIKVMMQDQYPYGGADGGGNYKAVRGMLNPNGTLIVQMLIFCIFLLIMGRLVFKPTVKVLDERSELVHRNHREAKDFTAKARAMQKEYDQKLAEVRLQAAKVISDRVHEAHDQAQTELIERQSALKDSVQAVRDDLAQQLAGQQDEVEKQVPELGKAMASKLLGREL